MSRPIPQDLRATFAAKGWVLPEAVEGVEIVCRLVYPNGDIREATAVRANTGLSPAHQTLKPIWTCTFTNVPLTPAEDVALLRAILRVVGVEKAANVAFELNVVATGGVDCS